MNIEEPKLLGELLGAADLSDFVTEVMSVSKTGPGLVRGDVVCRKADKTVTLAGAEATTPAEVYGIVLDGAIDPTVTGTEITATIARSGVYDATALRVDPSTTLSAFVDQLRVIGIFLEKANLVP